MRTLTTLLAVGCTFSPPRVAGEDGAAGSVDAADPDGADVVDGAASDGALPVVFAEVWYGGASGASATTDLDVVADPDAVYLLDVVTKPAEEITQVSGMGAIWAPVHGQCSGRSAQKVHVFIGVGAMTNQRVQVDADPATVSIALAVSRFGNVQGVPAVGTKMGANTAGGACTGGTDSASYSLTMATRADSHLHQAVARRASDLSPGGDFSERLALEVGPSGNVAGLSVLDRPAGGATSVPATGIFSSSTDWAVVLVELRR